VENMSYFKCPDCGKVHDIFGSSRAEATAAKTGIKMACRLPIAPALARAVDSGEVESLEEDMLQPFREVVEQLG